MGTYVRAKKKNQRSISDALEEAEQDHLIDCPDADFLVRSAAFILDLIFLTLIISGLSRLRAPILGILLTQDVSQSGHVLFHSLYLALQASLVYSYLLGSLMRFGGSPGKLLLNLRIVDVATGRKLGLYQAFLREVVGKTLSLLLFGIGFLIPIFHSEKRALHDLISGSTVKRNHE